MKHFLKTFLVFYIILLFFLVPVVSYARDRNINGIELEVDNSTGKLTIKSNPDDVITEEAAINAGLSKFKLVILLTLGFATLTMILILIRNFTLLGISSTNPQARQNIITGLIISFIAVTGLGGITVFFAFFYTLFQ